MKEWATKLVDVIALQMEINTILENIIEKRTILVGLKSSDNFVVEHVLEGLDKEIEDLKNKLAEKQDELHEINQELLGFITVG